MRRTAAKKYALIRLVEGSELPVHRTLRELLDNVTSADVYHGRRPAILARRERIRQRTLQQRRQENLRTPHPAAQRREVSLRNRLIWSPIV